MPLSTREVDRLGDRIKAGPMSEDDRRLLEEFRTSFLPPYQTVVNGIRESVSAQPTGRPEKRPESIIAKLRRGDVRHLSDMQDVAGCRMVVVARSRQDEVLARLRELFPDQRVVDRRQRPSYGYRAVHLVVKVERRQVEIQVRTILENLWAMIAEDNVGLIGGDLKHGIEPPDAAGVLGFMGWVSDAIDWLERRRRALPDGADQWDQDVQRRHFLSLLQGITAACMVSAGRR